MKTEEAIMTTSDAVWAVIVGIRDGIYDRELEPLMEAIGDRIQVLKVEGAQEPTWNGTG